jgi:hypothetical protein
MTGNNSNLYLIIFGGIIIGAILVYLLKCYRLKDEKLTDYASTKGQGCSSCEQTYQKNAARREAQKSLLPVMDAGFNLREISKQIILLEDHLFNTRKTCADCCVKHFLTIEGLAEEAITLDKDRKYSYLTKDLPDKIRAIEKHWIAGDNPADVAQELRAVRKSLQQNCFTIF